MIRVACLAGYLLLDTFYYARRQLLKRVFVRL